MKKSKTAVDQPMGIVIAAGRIAQNNPRVRAYYWCDIGTSDEKEVTTPTED